MTILTINNWYGRLGNNILQVINAVLVALYYKHLNVEIPSREFFNYTLLTINNEVPFNEDKLYELSGDFFYRKNITTQNPWIDEACFNCNHAEMLTHLRELFEFKYHTLTPLGENDLTIHIRSGDIFEQDGINCKYIQPPLSYYTNIIECGNYENIYLISQDYKNPCVKKLIDMYPVIKYSINNDIVNDIKLILRSTNIICSISSFVPTLLNLTDYTACIYVPSYFCELHNVLLNNKAKIVNIDLDDYRNKIGDWHNTEEQKELMISL
jgi:hypothetical protein